MTAVVAPFLVSAASPLCRVKSLSALDKVMARTYAQQHGAAEEDLDVFRCPGAFELAPLVKRVALSGQYHAVIALGCVIRGGTPHFEFVAGEATKGVGSVSLEAPCAVTFGVLTCDNTEQALERSGVKAGNKGVEAAVAAIEQANVFREVARLTKAKLTAVKKR